MIIGLTGGIGSGKSTVAEIFEVLGCMIFDSDKVAKEIYFDSTIKQKVIDLIGEESYLSEIAINKPYISKRIFSDKNLLFALNSIIHPAVSEKFKKFVAKHEAEIIVKESALLFEAKLEKQVDQIVMVTAPVELRISRIIKRDNTDREAVLKKINSQMPEEEKIKMADYVIRNEEEIFLTPQVIKLLKEITHA